MQKLRRYLTNMDMDHVADVVPLGNKQCWSGLMRDAESTTLAHLEKVIERGSDRLDEERIIRPFFYVDCDRHNIPIPNRVYEDEMKIDEEAVRATMLAPSFDEDINTIFCGDSDGEGYEYDVGEHVEVRARLPVSTVRTLSWS